MQNLEAPQPPEGGRVTQRLDRWIDGLSTKNQSRASKVLHGGFLASMGLSGALAILGQPYLSVPVLMLGGGGEAVAQRIDKGLKEQTANDPNRRPDRIFGGTKPR